MGWKGIRCFVNPVPPALRETGVPYVGAGLVGDYNLSAGSPAIDSANADAPGQQPTDLVGQRPGGRPGHGGHGGGGAHLR